MGDSSNNSENLNNLKAVEITGKIMVLAIVVLFVVVVAVLFLQLYARWFWWRVREEDSIHNSSHRRRRSGQDPPLPSRSGLNPAVLRSIPVVVYGPEDFKEGLECAVCLCDVAEGERARLLPKCNHGFHVECIDMWFQSHSTCPLCRSPVSSEYSEFNNARRRESGRVESSSGGDEFSESGSNSQASPLPVNVMFWGDEARVSSANGALDVANRDEQSCILGEPSSSEEGNRPEREGALVIEIPRQMMEDMRCPLTSGCPPDELKSPILGRLKSFGRLLSRERRVNPCSPNGAATVDMEQGGGNTIQFYGSPSIDKPPQSRIMG